MEKEQKPNLRLVKPANTLLPEEISSIEMKFNRLLVQALCFREYESYLTLMDSYKSYKLTADISILESKIKEFGGLFLLGTPSLGRLDIIKSTLQKVKELMSGLPHTTESEEPLRILSKKLIKAAIHDDKKTIARVVLMVNTFKLSKDFYRLKKDIESI